MGEKHQIYLWSRVNLKQVESDDKDAKMLATTSASLLCPSRHTYCINFQIRCHLVLWYQFEASMLPRFWVIAFKKLSVYPPARNVD